MTSEGDMLDDKLKEFLEFARTTDLQEVIWQKNGAKISFRRDVLPAAPEGEDRHGRPAPSAVPFVQGEGAAEPPAEVPFAPEPLYIRSTMVGTFYRGDTSDRPPLVVEGTLVNSGQPVGSIEAMKIRKDVLSQYKGRIVRSLVADGHSVEYGQPLFEIEEADEGNGNGNGHV